MVDEVILLAGKLGAHGEDLGVLHLVCKSAVEELTLRLGEGYAAQDCGAVFPVAAAMLALDTLEGMKSGGVESFSAGNVTLKKDGGGKLRARAEALMAPFLGGGGFAARGVPG